MYKNQILALTDRMRFGKHYGDTIACIVEKHPSYIKWMIENIDNIAFSNDVISRMHLSDDLVKNNTRKLKEFYNKAISYNKRYSNYRSYEDSDWEKDTWYAMTDGAYGDYPGGDSDFSFMGY